jgi:hypothetical protein
MARILDDILVVQVPINQISLCVFRQFHESILSTQLIGNGDQPLPVPTTIKGTFSYKGNHPDALSGSRPESKRPRREPPLNPRMANDQNSHTTPTA